MSLKKEEEMSTNTKILEAN